MHQYSRLILLCAVFFSLLLAGCDTRKDYSVDIAAIYKVLEARAEAISAKDLARYDDVIFPEYSDRGLKREQVLEDIKQTFEQYPDLTLQMPRIRPDVKRNSARIMQSSFYRSGADKPEVQIQETLMFRKLKDRWYISGGIALGVARSLRNKE